MPLATIAAGAIILSAGASLYDKYQQGSAREDIDYDAMLSAEKDVYDEKIEMLGEKLGIKTDQILANRRAGSMALENQNMRLSDIYFANTRRSGLSESGTLEHSLSRGREQIGGQNTANMRKSALAIDMAEQNRDIQTASLYEDYLSTKSDLELQRERSEAWYPGKYIGSAFGAVGSLFG